jgi:phosphoribosylformylglycinamidine cyclo-ligase
VERSRIVDGARVQIGDALVGAASTGLHSNGFALARRVLLEMPGARPGAALYEELLVPTRIYAKDVLSLMDAVDVRAVAHITGGGLPGNVPRVLPRGTRARLREAAWPRPEIFSRIEREGGVERAEMYRTFNMGLGLVVAVPPGHALRATETLRARGVPAWVAGEVVAGAGEADVEIV